MTASLSRRLPSPMVLWVAAVTLAAFAVRVYATYRSALGEDYVAFVENDAWYHMRLVDALIESFPTPLWEDPYLLHPGGQSVNVGPMFDWIIAAAALLIGAGAPSARLIDLVGAYTPAVLGALTVVPVFAIGRVLVSARAGLWAAWSVAVVPSGLLLRSTVGFTDHHCAEALFTTLALWFLVCALDPERTFRQAMRQSVMAGFALGAYLLTWSGASLFIAALVAWASLELIRSVFVGGRHGERAAITLAPMLGVPLLMILPWVSAHGFFTYGAVSLAGGLVAVGGLLALRWLTRERPLGQWLFGLGCVMACGVAAGVLQVLGTESVSGLLADMSRMSPWRDAGFVTEAAPLMRSPLWGIVPLWPEFTTAVPLAVIGVAISLGRVGRHQQGWRLVFVWGLACLAATFGQIRFSYYLIVPVSLLAGSAGDALVEAVAARLTAPAAHRGAVWASVAVITLAIMLPGVPRLRQRAESGPAVSADWFDALQWMRTNTPEPFGDAGTYFSSRASKAHYGVLAWWDYGYWVTRIARRVPVANPRQSGVGDAAAFYLANSPTDAAAILDRVGARYVVADAMLQMSIDTSRADQDIPGFLAGIARAGGRRADEFCETLRPMFQRGDATQVYCYDEYYRLMAIRLYAFGGQAVIPSDIWVIDVDRSGSGRPKVRGEWRFTSYDEAVAFTRLRPAGRFRIASKNPLISPVPLERLEAFTPVFRSLGHQDASGSQPGPAAVQVFEYAGAGFH